MTSISRPPADRAPMDGRVDFTMMYAAHDAFARDLRYLISACAAGHAWSRTTTARWQMFEKQLHIHHRAEDTSLWPLLRPVVPTPAGVAVLDAMAAEHITIDPQLQRVSEAFADLDEASLDQALHTLTIELSVHMLHEENDALPLVERYLGPAGWEAFGTNIRMTQGVRGAAEYLPWLLDEASDEQRAKVLRLLPLPVRLLYRLRWEPRYRRRFALPSRRK
jgi:hypothetical protein